MLRILQSVVAASLNDNFAKRVAGSAGNGKTPKSHTIEPVPPKVGLKVILFGVGKGENKTVPVALPAT